MASLPREPSPPLSQEEGPPVVDLSAPPMLYRAKSCALFGPVDLTAVEEAAYYEEMEQRRDEQKAAGPAVLPRLPMVPFDVSAGPPVLFRSESLAPPPPSRAPGLHAPEQADALLPPMVGASSRSESMGALSEGMARQNVSDE